MTEDAIRPCLLAFAGFILVLVAVPRLRAQSVYTWRGTDCASAADVFGDSEAKMLTQAIQRLDEKAARTLLESGVDINAKGRRRVTPLLFLVTHEETEAVRLALKLGADPNVSSGSGDTPLYYATKAENWETLLKILVRAGADVEKASKLTRLRTCYPIERRVFQRIRTLFDHGNPEPLWWLLERGGNVNAQDCRGHTLLQVAYAGHLFDLAYGLLERGANPHIHIRGESFVEMVRRRPTGPFDETEAHWMEKVHTKVEELSENQKLIREAREIDAAFGEFYERYRRTPRGAREERRRREIGAIVDTLKERVQGAKEDDSETKPDR